MLAHLNLIALCTTGKCKKQCGKAPVGGGRIRKVGVWQAVGEATEKNFGLASTQERKSGLGSREMPILAGFILVQPKERLNETSTCALEKHANWVPQGFS